MSLKIDSLEIFKKHRNEASESLFTNIIGRDAEIEELSSKIDNGDYLAITGHAGVGKSRLAVGAIEYYCLKHPDFEVLCTKNFSNYIEALDNTIEEGRKYIVFIDDANNYSRLIELLEFLKYKNNNINIKVILTVRDYLKSCLDEDMDVGFYEVKPLSDESIKEAIIKNTPIRNEDWLKQIVKIANGNIRVAFLAANEAVNDGEGFPSLFNQKDVLTKFYKDEISKIDRSESLLKTAGIVAFFRSVYLEQLFYIAPILKSVNLSKQRFIENVNVLISMEIIDDYKNVVKIADQCFADFLLNYTILEKRYFNIKDLILIGFKYYKKRIVESIQTILHVYNTEEFLGYLKEEVTKACDLLEHDIVLKHGVEACFAQIIPEYVSREYINGVETYNDKKDIKWLLNVFSGLTFSDYNEIANEGVLKLLKKTKEKAKDVYEAINNTYGMTVERAKEKFRYQVSFIKKLQNENLYNDEFHKLISSYLKFSFNYSLFKSKTEIMRYSFEIDDNVAGILEFRSVCWNYLFNFEESKVIEEIMAFANGHYDEGCVKIIENDLKRIDYYLGEHDANDLVKTFLCVKFIDYAKKYDFANLLTGNKKYFDLFNLIIGKRMPDEDYNHFISRYRKSVEEFYNANEDNVYQILSETGDFLDNYYKWQKTHFVEVLLDVVDEPTDELFFLCVRNRMAPCLVIEKCIKSLSFEKVYGLINEINDESTKDEYLYNFYNCIGKENVKNDYSFMDWLKSKGDSKTSNTYHRDALSLRNIAERCGLNYVELIRKLYSKRKYNPFIAETYLSYLINNDGAFKELLDLNDRLAINVYEFLLDNKVKDYESKILKEILLVQHSYVKVLAKEFIDGERYDDCDLHIVFENEFCKAFFDECMKTMLSKTYRCASFKLRALISSNINQINLDIWIKKYIDSNYKSDEVMELLFQALAEVEYGCKKKYLLYYYQKGNDINVLKYAISKMHSYSDLEKYFCHEIEQLEELKKAFLNWNGVEEMLFIDSVIQGYRNEIKNYQIEQLIDYPDQRIVEELEERDFKTEVPLKDAFELYQNNAKFREMISSGYFSYKEGSFIGKDDQPLKFADVLKNKKIISIKVMASNGSDNSNYEEYLSSLKCIKDAFDMNNVATLDDCLNKLMDEKKWDTKDFQCETYLTRDLFSKIRNNKKNKMAKRTLIQILIGLQPSKAERNHLLALNGTQLSGLVKEDALYNFLLNTKVDIATADGLLKDAEEEGF